MARGAFGAFVIPWLECELDGVAGAAPEAMMVGATWQWFGQALRLDGPLNVLPLGPSLGDDALRKRAAKSALKINGHGPDQHAEDDGELLFGPSFSVSDGRRHWRFSVIEGGARGPLCLTLDGVPPRDTALHVVEASLSSSRARSRPGKAVVCFTPGTLIDTPHGPRRVEEIEEGDLLQTKDNGPQEVVWRAERWISGARLQAMPELAPVRLGQGALGVDIPDAPLLVSPDHRVLLRGARAQALFNTSEVLVAARDLIDDRRVRVERGHRSLTYIHLALPSHQVVFANRVETESFDPVAAGLDHLGQDDRGRLLERLPDLMGDVHCYGAPARRVLTRAEAAILRADAGA